MFEQYLAAKPDHRKSPEARKRCRRNRAPQVEAQKHAKIRTASGTASEGRGRAASRWEHHLGGFPVAYEKTSRAFTPKMVIQAVLRKAGSTLFDNCSCSE
jgi:hypothetical protein